MADYFPPYRPSKGAMRTRSLTFPALASFSLLILAFVFSGPRFVQSQGLENLKIGVVNLNLALNRSQAGERSQSILLASKNQIENEIKAKEADLKKKLDSLKNNIMLTEEARSKQQKELRTQQRALAKKVREAQRELQAKERKLTGSIVIELKTVINEIAKEENLDIVLDKNFFENVILYSKVEEHDITKKVIARYNKFQGGQ
jgi:Skp family chaperone for outer membrane proteins